MNMTSVRVQPPREAAKRNRPKTRQQTVLQNSAESLATKKRHARQKKASHPANDFKSSTIELSSPTFTVAFMSELYKLYQQGICCDVILSTGDYQTSAHKVVLMASSEYFKSLFLVHSSGNDFIVMPSGVSGESLQSLVRFMYTGGLILNSENIRFLLRAATQLQVKAAIDICRRFLNDNENLFSVAGIPSLASEKLENNFDQLPEIQIKEESSFVDDVPNVVDFSPLGSKVESNESSSSNNTTQVETCLSRARSVAHRTRNKRKLGENLLNKRKQRRSTSSKTRVKRNAQMLRKKSVFSRSSLARRSKSPHAYRHQLLVSGALHKCCLCGSGFEKYSGLLFHRKSCHGMSPHSHNLRLARNLRRRAVFIKSNSLSLIVHPAGNNFSEATKWFCPLCHCHFSRSSWCRAHILKLHPLKYRQLSLQHTKLLPRCSLLERATCLGVLKCSSCRQPFLHRSNLLTHRATNHRRAKEEGCGEIHRGRKKGQSDWCCQQNDCSAVCRSAEELKKHMAADHPAVLFSCPDCKFTSQVERIFLRHRTQRHGKMMMCHICGKGCYKLYLLRQHMYVHHKIRDPSLKLFQCSQEGCVYECSSKKRLDDHFRRHTLMKSLTCDVCGKGFKHSIGLERHVSAIHQGIRPYICDQCGMGFGLEHELKTHIARHSNNKPHACDQCPYRTFDKINLQSHLFSQHNIQTNRKIIIFKCDQCSFTTNRKGRYDDHMKKHQDIKDIPCPECGKLFHSKRNLYGHTVKVHRPKSLHCSLCNFSTAIRSKFKEHMQKKHIRSPMAAATNMSSEVTGCG